MNLCSLEHESLLVENRDAGITELRLNHASIKD